MPIEFKDAHDNNGKAIPGQLRYLAIKNAKEAGIFSSGAGDEKEQSDPALLLGPDDVKKHKTKEGKDIYALNIARRALNLAFLWIYKF